MCKPRPLYLPLPPVCTWCLQPKAICPMRPWRARTRSDPRFLPLQTAPTGRPVEPQNRRRTGRPEGKIDGMDYYGWCELLRSSSL